jgi:thioredoxin:protein disulfide reductase
VSLRRSVSAALLLLFGAGPVRAQVLGGEMPDAADLVKVTAAPLEVAAGAAARAKVTITIVAGWHANANPPSLDYMIPTDVSIAGAPDLAVGRPSYPPGKKVKLSFEETELSVYDGSAIVEVPITAKPEAVGGARTLKGRVRFQACNDEVCLAPATIPFTVALTVKDGATGGVAPPPQDTLPATDSTFATAPPEGGERPAAPPGSIEERLQAAMEQGAVPWLFALFVGGLLLNLTPCVFPMLGVTVSVFGARRKEPLPKVLTAAVLYVLGISVTYTALGVVAGLTGGLFGSALQSIWVNVALGLVLIALSLSMFGFYEMQPPAWILQRIGGANTASVLGIFVSGLGVGIIAAPCVGPFVVAVLALIAQRADVMFGVKTMFALSIGLGFPYLFLAAFSNLLQRLPRSGDWMVWVKKVFGVILLSVGVFYLVIGLAADLSSWVLPAGLIAGGAYLGFFAGGAMGKPAFRRMQMALGTLAALAGAWVILTTPKAPLELQAFDQSRLEAGFAEGKIAMVDFSADWCVPCHELERITFTDEDVKSLARSFHVYQVDLTRLDSPEAERWRKDYGVRGVPTVIFLTPDGREVREARVEGFLSPEQFIERMRTASGKRTAEATSGS